MTQIEEPAETAQVSEPADLSRRGRHRRAASAPAHWWSRVPRAVWLVTGLHVAVALAFTFLYPAYNAPDEPDHVDRVVATQHGNVIPDPGTLALTRAVTNTYVGEYNPEHRPFIQPPLPRGERPSLRSLGDDVAGDYPFPNQLSQHPPAFYLLGAGFLDAIPGSGGLPWDQTVWLLRLLDVLLIAPLPLLCWAAVRRFVSEPVAIAASFTPLLIPAFERIGAAVNNDNLLNLSTAALLVLLVGVGCGDLRRRTALWVAFWALLSLLTKGFALAWPPVIVLVYVIGWRRTRADTDAPARGIRALAAPLGIAVAGCVLGGMWWLRNVIEFGAVQPNGFGDKAREAMGPGAPAGFHASVGGYAKGVTETLSANFWGALGLIEPPNLPHILCFALTAALVVAIVVGLVLGRGDRALFAVLLLPSVFVACIVIANSWHPYELTGRIIGSQGRYLFPGLVGLAVVAFVGIDRALARWPRALHAVPLLACVGACLLQLLALRYILLGYWLAPGVSVREGIGDAIAQIARFSPYPVGVTLVPFVAVALLAVVTLAVTIRWATRARRTAAPESVAA